MPFPVELQNKVDAMKASLGGGDPSADDEMSVLQRKLQKRKDAGGYAANVAELERRIGELG